MARLGRWLRRIAVVLAALALLVGAAFAVLQTSAGRRWAADAAAHLASRPGYRISIAGLAGTIPFDMRAERIEAADAAGTWLVIRDPHFAMSVADLFGGLVHIRALTAAAIEVARLPETGSTGFSLPSLPRLPLAVAVDRLEVGRLALAAPVLGEPVAATLSGNAALRGGVGRAALDLHRIDGQPGTLALQAELSGAEPVLGIRLDADEPTGVVLDRVLGRSDHPPLRLSFAGEGPLSQWRGRLTAAAGSLARLDAAVTLAGGRDLAVTLDGTAQAVPLLPPALAPLVGDRVPLHLRTVFAENGRVTLDRLSLRLAAGTIAGEASFGGPERRLAGRLQADFPHLSAAAASVGRPLEGSARIVATLSGSEAQPELGIDAVADAVRVENGSARHVETHVSVAATGDVAAHGRIEGVAFPPGLAVPEALGRDLAWSLAAHLGSGGEVAVSRLAVHGIGLDLEGSGRFAPGPQIGDGHLHLAVADLRPLTPLFGVAVEGTAALDATQTGPTALRFELSAPVAVEGVKLSLDGHGSFDPATRRLDATLDAAAASLEPLAAGRLTARLTAAGTLDRPEVAAELDAAGLRAGAAGLDALHAEARLPDLTARKGTVAARFRRGALDGRLSLEADAGNPAELAIPRLHLEAADGTVDGRLVIDLATRLVRGTLSARLPTLARWSALTGLPLAGSVELKASLEPKDGQAVDLDARGDRLSLGRLAIGRAEAAAHLTDAFGAAVGKARLRLAAVALGPGRFDTATLSVASTRPGRFAVTADARGRFGDPVSLAARGEVEPGAMEFRLASLDAALGSGRIAGSATLRGRALSARLTAHNLPVAAAARLAGYDGAGGTLSLDAAVSGTTAAPRGHFTLAGRGLTVAQGGQRLPALGIDATGDWNGRDLRLDGKLGGLKGEALAFHGSLPVVLTSAPLSLRLPPSGHVAMRLTGGGELGSIADLLPLGEDRLSGRFTLDAGVDGTLAAPTASGRLAIAGGRYESFATGAVLTNLKIEAVGDRSRFVLRSLSADDGAGGSIAAHGDVSLAGTRTVEFAATLKGFRIAALDEAVVTASGTVGVAGSLAGPKVTGNLTVDRADCTIPDSLPPTVTKIAVINVNLPPGAARRAKPPPHAAVFAAPLDIRIDMPGRIFVRGHGLDSEWAGRLKVTGTTAAPALAGSIHSVRGTFDILGKTFQVTHGVIVFPGGTDFNPRLDITAEVAAADITAQAMVGGTASAPTVTLSSTPVVPQDEILSRVLFGRGLGQITAGEGLQVAQAAATLAGGGPGILDKLRSGLGLDRLSFGGAAQGPASSNLNPAAGGSATGGPALSGGKYIANGVYVGATQGTTPGSTKVTVEIEVYPHVTVETDRSQSGGTGIGLNYKYDY